MALARWVVALFLYGVIVAFGAGFALLTNWGG